jgi:hypothetical protein
VLELLSSITPTPPATPCAMLSPLLSSANSARPCAGSSSCDSTPPSLGSPVGGAVVCCTSDCAGATCASALPGSPAKACDQRCMFMRRGCSRSSETAKKIATKIWGEQLLMRAERSMPWPTCQTLHHSCVWCVRAHVLGSLLLLMQHASACSCSVRHTLHLMKKVID